MANLRRDVGKCRNVGHRLSCSSRGNENQATNVPVIYSNQSMTVTANENSKFSLLIDIYGAVFSLFRGYDELIHCEKSSHDRDLLDACCAYRLELIMQPIVDEYVGLLCVSIRYRSPSLIRLLPSLEKFVHCDIDTSNLPCLQKLRLALRIASGDILNRRFLKESLYTLNYHYQLSRGNLAKDPHHGSIAWIIELNARHCKQVYWYTMLEGTQTRYDQVFSLFKPCNQSCSRSMNAGT